jgi:phosphoribosylformylglycinamidine (FGAM) synthase-like enzyme
VGLRDQIENIPFDQFTAESDLVYWLKLPMVKSFAGSNIDLGFAGEFDPKAAKDFVSLNLQLSKYYSSSKTVGRGGLAHALAMMSMGEFSFHSHSPILESMKDADFFREDLYEVVVSVPSRLRDDFEKEWCKLASTQMQMLWIGLVGTGNLKMRGDLVVDKKDVLKKYGASYEAFMA